MLKTGNIFIDYFSQIIIFFPLLPVIIVLLRKIYQEDILNFLMLLCLLNFCQDIVLLTLQATYFNRFSLHNIFSVFEFIIILRIFKSVLKGKPKEIINIITIAFLSAIVTYFFVRGAGQKIILFDLIQNAFIIFLTAYCLVKIVRNTYLQVFYSPLFWIATGTLFYFVIDIIMNIMDGCCLQLPYSAIMDKTLLLNIANLARYFFYILAAFLYGKKTIS